MNYHPENVFSKIIRGDMPCVKVWEDADNICIMDIFPEYPGHCLVLPKEQAETLFELTPAGKDKLWGCVYKMAEAVARAYPECGVALMQLNGAQAGQTVPHVHVHIIPRRLDIQPMPHGQKLAQPEELERNAQKIRDCL